MRAPPWPAGAYAGSYELRKQREWAERIRAWKMELRAVYVYFDNDQAGFAVENARTLREMLEQ